MKSLRIIFGKNLRMYRERKQYSQEKLADLCNLHRTYISDIECFKRNVSLDNIEKIANALEIPASDLLFIPEEKED